MNAKLVFILYDSRSGSTYLSALLNRYKGISVFPESAFVSHIIEYPGKICRANLNSILDYLQQEIQFRELELDLDELKHSLARFEHKLTAKKLIQAIIGQYFSETTAETACYVIKHPPYPYLSTVIEMFPEVQFLQIIRDGRAVFNSKKKTYSLNGSKMTTNPLKAAWDWRLKLQKAEKFTERTTTIFYEDLIQNQEQTLFYILKRLKIPQEGKKITKKQSDYLHNIGKAQKGLHKNISKSPQTNAIDKWKQELSASEINVYNFINQKYLQKYNYPVVQPIPKRSVVIYGGYLLKFMSIKLKNIGMMLKKPSLLKLKFYRNYFLFRDEG